MPTLPLLVAPLLLIFTTACTPSLATPALWPLPYSVTTSSATRPLADSSLFSFHPLSPPSPRLSRAIDRYTALLFGSHHSSPSSQRQPSSTVTTSESAPLSTVTITIHSTNETLFLGADESFSLTLTPGASSAALTAPTLWGALHGLDKFVQLAEKGLSVPDSFAITDKPRFPYRGLMIDTARHFMSVEHLLHILDTMAWSSLNVLHIHITDDQSFPIESKRFPALSQRGAFFPSYVYTQANISTIVDYATDRGILVVPEFDMPAHSSAWGAGEPSILVNCSAPFTHGSAMNPTVPSVYTFLASFLEEMMDLFPSAYIHLGGDEVPTSCWLSDPAIATWMKAHNMTSFNQLEAYFVRQVLPSVVKGGRTPMYWQEIFDNNPTALPKNTIFEGWKSDVLGDIVKAGYLGVNSYKWYLNHGCDTYGDGDWTGFYENDPLLWAPGLSGEEQLRLLGGETTMWNVCVDAQSFDSIVWPRAAAAAEQLWSPATETKNATNAADRFAVHRCRLVNRGVRAAPLDTSLARAAQCGA